MKTYILGPMRRKPLFNFPEFDRVAAIGRAAGHTIINPADLDRDAGFDPANLPVTWDWSSTPPGFDMRDAVERDIASILKCDSYVCLEGWQKSVGASAEQKLLAWLGAVRLNEDFTVYTEPDVIVLPAFPFEPIERPNPKDAYGLKKAPLRLAPPIAVIQLSKAMAIGAAKYGECNWRTDKPRFTVYLEAALRHLYALLDGQDNDEESGLPHAAHIMANCAIILDAAACGTLKDDRSKSGKVSELLK